jgi:hypothetical protein
MEMIQKEIATGSLGLRKPLRSAVAAAAKVIADDEDMVEVVWRVLEKIDN